MSVTSTLSVSHCLPPVQPYSVGVRGQSREGLSQARLPGNAALRDDRVQEESDGDYSRKLQRLENPQEKQLPDTTNWNVYQDEESALNENDEAHIEKKPIAISPPKHHRKKGNNDKSSSGLKNGETGKQPTRSDPADDVRKPRRKRDADELEPIREGEDDDVGGGNQFPGVPLQMISRDGDNEDWTRIIDGRPTHPDRWPWSVALVTEEYGFICGGVLIRRDWVMTSAHCVDGAK